MPKNIRLFVSSTFSDFRSERETLRHEVFPRLEHLCAKHGVRFQPVDLRWGVSRAAAENRQAIEICLQEIDRCRRMSAGPYFIALVGERYGWCPLPSTIPLAHFERIMGELGGGGRDRARRRALLERWYRRCDENAVPPVYVLRQRSRNSATWKRIEWDLRALLREVTEGFDEEDRLRYVASATEQEIERGVLSVADVQGRAFCFLRRIQGLPARSAAARKFLDLGEDGGHPSEYATVRLKSLRLRLGEKLPKGTFHYRAHWRDRALDPAYLRCFARAAYQALSGAIIEALQDAPQTVATEEESAAHEDFRLGRIARADGASFFTGRRNYLRRIARYVRGDARHPLVVHGAAGVGKSAVMAQAIGAARARRDPPAVFQRFCGATPDATSVRTLLASLCAELALATGADAPPGGGSYEEVAHEFAERVHAAAAVRPLAIFVDALDQLRDLGEPPRLHWIPTTLPANVRIVVSAKSGPILDAVRERLPSRTEVELPPMAATEGAALLRKWLEQADRTLQSPQLALLQERFAENGLPLYLRLAFEEARRWRSYERGSLARDINGLVGMLSKRLARPANHGQVLVDRSLAYLLASRDGLADEEVLDLLSWDREVMEDFARRSPDSPRVKELPPIVWTRLYFDLEPYLATTPSEGALLLRFYHQEFGEGMARRHADPGRHGAMARYFAARGYRPGSEPDSPADTRTLTELPYQFARAGYTEKLRRVLSDFDFVQTKVEALGPQPLLEDYRLRTNDKPAAVARLAPVARALERAAHVLERDRLQTGGQLLARALEERSPPLPRFLADASEWRGRHWMRPLSASLATSGPLIRTLTGSGEHTNGIAVAPSGRFLVSCANEGAVRVWDLRTGIETRSLEGHSEWVKDVAVMPDERRVVSVSFDSTIRIWDLTSYDPPHVLPTAGRAWSVVLFPDGRRCAVGAGRCVQVWDLDDCALLAEGKDHAEEVTVVAVTPDGTRIVSLSEDQTVRVWDASSMKLVRTLRGEDVDPRRWRKETPGGGSRSMHPEWTPYALALTPDGRGVLAARRDQTIRLRELDTGAEVAKLVGHDSTVDSVAVDAAGKLAASGSWDGKLRVWRLPSGEAVRTLRHGASSLGPVEFAPGGRIVYSGTGDGRILAWDLDAPDAATRPGAAHPEHSEAITAVCATRNRLLSASRDGTILVWDRRNARLVRRLDFEGSVSAMATSPNGRTLFVTGIGQYGRKTSRGAIAGRSKLEYVSFKYGGIYDFQQLQVTPDGRRLVGCGFDGTWVLDLQTGKVDCQLDLYSRWIAITPDGRYVLGAYKRDVCRVPIGGGRRETLFSPGAEVWRATLLPNGETLACFSLDGATQLWNVGARPRKPRLELPGEAVTGAASGDGRHLVTALRESQLVWWDLADGAPLARFDGVGPMSECSLAQDGKTLVAGEDTGRVHLIVLEEPRHRATRAHRGRAR